MGSACFGVRIPRTHLESSIWPDNAEWTSLAVIDGHMS